MSFDKAIRVALTEYARWLDRNMAKTHGMSEQEKIDLFWDEMLAGKTAEQKQ